MRGIPASTLAVPRGRASRRRRAVARSRRRAALLLVACCAAATACSSAAASAERAAAASGSAEHAPRETQAVDLTRARQMLAELPVRVEDTGAHYNRDDWGSWRTRSGCDTRERVLLRDGQDVTTGDDCKITGGVWVSVYDGRTHTDPAALEIDHRVAPREALRSGARGWTREQRVAFYNDMANLTAVTASVNESKGDRDPGRWRPSDRSAWCSYAASYIATKHDYGLHIDRDEHAGLTAMLNSCPAQGESQ